MADATSPFDNSHYERACDEAIAMCDGNLRSTIKALIMANEYLETELLDLQDAISSGCIELESKRSTMSRRLRRSTSAFDGADVAAFAGGFRIGGTGAGGGVSEAAGIGSDGTSSKSNVSIVCGLSSSTTEKSTFFRPRTALPSLSRTTTLT